MSRYSQHEMKTVTYTCDYGNCRDEISNPDNRVTIPDPEEELHFHQNCWTIVRCFISNPDKKQTDLDSI